MKKFVLATMAMAFVVGAQAQLRSFTAQGLLQPLSGQVEEDILLEVLGKGPDGDFSEYYSFDLLPGLVQSAIAAHTAALAAPVLNPYAQARASFSYDLSAPNTSTVAGLGFYRGAGFGLALSGAGVVTNTLQVSSADLFVRERNTRRNFGVSGSGAGYPPAPLAQSEPLVISDAAAPMFKFDLYGMLGGASCCSSLHLSAPGPLWVQLQAPTEYHPVYMGLSLAGSRNAAEPMDASLPAEFDLSRYDTAQELYVIFGGHYSLSVDEAAYASQADFLAAKTWVDGNISLVNIEIPMFYALTGLQAAPVPEPATAGLLAAGVLGLVVRRRRHRAPQ